MEHKINNHAFDNAKNLFIGLLIGSLAGAAAMLLFAPQSGKETRTQIQQKSVELRDKATDFVNDTIDHVRGETKKLTDGMREKAEEFKQKGQKKLAEELDRMSAVIDAGKKAVEAS